MALCAFFWRMDPPPKNTKSNIIVCAKNDICNMTHLLFIFFKVSDQISESFTADYIRWSPMIINKGIVGACGQGVPELKVWVP